MKKFNTILLAVILLANIIFVNTSAFSAASENNSLENRQKTLIALGIMSENSEGVIDNEKQITRAEFAASLAGFLNVNPTLLATSSYYYDVPVDAWYTNAVNTLTEYRIISGDENKMFYPDNVITVNEAVKMVVCLLGYRVFADGKGGYPNGYTATASELGLLDAMPQGTQLTNEHMTILLYNALDIQMTQMDFSGGDVSVSDNGKTLLEYYKNIYEGEGVIESIYGMTSFGSTVSRRSDAVIDGINYTSDDFGSLRDNFGRRVRFYYYDNESEGTRELVYIEPWYTDDVMVISDDDFAGYDSASGVISYYSGNRTLTARLGRDAVIIKNGAVIDTDVSNSLNIDNGELKLIDSNGDGAYDLCCVEELKTVIAKFVNAESRTITYEQVSGDTALKNASMEFPGEAMALTIYSSTGAVVDFNAITSGAVLDIAVSADNSSAVIYINTDTIEGTLESIMHSEAEMSVNGTRYKYYPAMTELYPVNPGDSGIFKLNHYGKIAYFERRASDGETLPVAYLIKAYIFTEGDESCMIKYLDASGEILTKKVSNKVSIDGEKASTERALSVLQNAVGTVIALYINSDDEVIKIDTVTQGSNEDENALVKTLEDNQSNTNGNRWTSSTSTFGKKTVVSDSPIVFVVPPTGSDYEKFKDDADSYRIGALTEMLTNWDYHTECYRLGKSVYSNIVVWYQYKYESPDRNRFIMVEQVAQAVDKDGNIVATIKGYQGATPVSINVSLEDYKIGTTSDCDIILHRGDVITVGAQDKNGNIGTVEVHFDISRNWSGLNQICLGGSMFDRPSYANYDAMYYWLNFNDLQNYTRFIAGCPTEIDGEIMKFKYPPASSADNSGMYTWRQWSLPQDENDWDELAIIENGTPVIVYDMAADCVFEGSVADIMTADMYGCPSQVMLDKYWGEVVAVYVINNNEDAWNRPDEMK
ncbi:MAG TPA: S-layer homology domain-containing protein [Candidatus Ornithomonoglobus intestinigallinarum]|uniref:S-layer homology domain-containing protein n=1 Tax=Candidatus Ornithomonoglobus intestinigallinarum TaxID=2840894 RepID=A0A9D1KQ05_9FIRM|nr:S-layer homology domain-containing protein [Candidatus Ornithomonoglobus intestinigallinarum]